jgi:hypothetical protein
MPLILHFNTFFGENAEIAKMDVLDAVFDNLGNTNSVLQKFENPEDEDDGFDLYLKYDLEINLDFALLKQLGDEHEIYVLVYDLTKGTRTGYWFDEDDAWVTSSLSNETIQEINRLFE